MARQRDRFRGILRVALGLAVVTTLAAEASGCPFCAATQQTLGEELESADAAVLAELIKAPPPYDPTQDNGASYRGLDPEANNATFRIVEKLRGGEHLVASETIELPFFGEADKDKLFLITGIRTDRLDWTTPLPLSKDAEGYVRRLLELPEEGADRLAFFQEYLEHDDPMLAQDAYDEFARAPYDAVIGLKDRMHHDRLVAWIHDVELAPSRRRLYLTMLGVCGRDSDLRMLEFYMSPSEAHFKAAADVALAAAPAPAQLVRPVLDEAFQRYERLKKQGLDAMIACYLTLRGPAGLPLVEDLFLSDPEGDFKEIFSAIYALRFHGEETEVIPRERLIESMRLVLDNPTFADQVIPDLSRWEDWGAMDRLAEMFEEADENSYIRQPVATYMLIASEQEGKVGERATAYLQELRQVDEQAVDDAERNLGFGLFARAMPQGETSPAAAAEASRATGPATRDAPTSTPQAAEVKTALPAGTAPAETPPTDAPIETTAANLRAESATPPDAALSARGDAADQPPPEQTAEGSARAEAGAATRPFSPEEAESVAPPSRWAIIGGTAAAVIVLAALFGILLRGFGSRTA